jgi:hypothetical protein
MCLSQGLSSDSTDIQERPVSHRSRAGHMLEDGQWQVRVVHLDGAICLESKRQAAHDIVH